MDLYRFPDITNETLPETGVEAESGDIFQRTNFRDFGRSIPGSPQEQSEEEKSKQIEQMAYIEGFSKGEKAGIESGNQKLVPVLNNFSDALFELEKVKHEIYKSAEKQTVELALAIARKIVCNEIATNKNVVLNVVREALKKVADNENIVIKISPADHKFIKEAKFETLNQFDKLGGITIKEDETILNGGCVIETNLGYIDARIEQQLQAVEEAFKNELKKTGLGG